MDPLIDVHVLSTCASAGVAVFIVFPWLAPTASEVAPACFRRSCLLNCRFIHGRTQGPSNSLLIVWL